MLLGCVRLLDCLHLGEERRPRRHLHLQRDEHPVQLLACSRCRRLSADHGGEGAASMRRGCSPALSSLLVPSSRRVPTTCGRCPRLVRDVSWTPLHPTPLPAPSQTLRIRPTSRAVTRRSRASAAKLFASSPPRPSAWRAAPSDSQPPACEAAPPGTGAGTGEWELISDRRGCSPLAAARKRRLGESPILQQVRRVVGGRLRNGWGQTHSSGESGGASTASSESWRSP